jgi:hypothetical protein
MKKRRLPRIEKERFCRKNPFHFSVFSSVFYLCFVHFSAEILQQPSLIILCFHVIICCPLKCVLLEKSANSSAQLISSKEWEIWRGINSSKKYQGKAAREKK